MSGGYMSAGCMSGGYVTGGFMFGRCICYGTDAGMVGFMYSLAGAIFYVHGRWVHGPWVWWVHA
jgi:hypothetical protein